MSCPFSGRILTGQYSLYHMILTFEDANPGHFPHLSLKLKDFSFCYNERNYLHDVELTVVVSNCSAITFVDGDERRLGDGSSVPKRSEGRREDDGTVPDGESVICLSSYSSESEIILALLPDDTKRGDLN